MYIEALFFAAETVLLVSYLFTDILLLRAITMISDLVFIGASTYVGFDSPGMTATCLFAMSSFALNLYHIYLIVGVRIPARLQDELKPAYNKWFKTFRHREFLYLLNMGQVREVSNETLVQKGNETTPFLLLAGEVHVFVDGIEMAILEPGDIFGEVSYLLHRPAIATIKAHKRARVCHWSEKDLLRIKRRHSEILSNFEKIMIQSISEKLANQNKYGTVVHMHK